MSIGSDREFINGQARQSMGLQGVENLHMNFDQATDFVNGASRQSMGIDDVSNLQMNVPVAHVMRSVANNNFIEGTFVGNGTNYVDVPCPFEPNIALAFSDELGSNPGIGPGIIMALSLKNLSMSSLLRYTSATSTPVNGGGKKTLSWVYENGIFRLSTQSTGTAYNFFSGYTYKYFLLQ